MTKPIFIVGLPFELTVEQLESTQKLLEGKLDQYYVICYIDINADTEFSFQCFFEKDFNEVKFEELKNIVRESVLTKQEQP